MNAVRQREKAVGSVVMEIETEGSFPDGSRFRTSGTLRVLGKTHFQSRMAAHFGDDVEAETETVKTPDGISMREKDPVQGEVFTRMDAGLMRRLESATEFLGAESGLPGMAGGQAQGPLASAMLEDLNLQFDLDVDGPQVIDEQECFVVKGPVRIGAVGERPDGLDSDRVELLLRKRDMAVVRMTQFKEGEPLLDVRMRNLELDRPLEAASFELEIPPKADVIDVNDHPPAAAQIARILQEATEKGWVDPTLVVPGEPGEAGGPTEGGQQGEKEKKGSAPR